MIKPSRTVMAKTAPYWLATGIRSLLATGTISRLAAPVTFTITTAVPLGLIISDLLKNNKIKKASNIFGVMYLIRYLCKK
jgi:hypothetical protein